MREAQQEGGLVMATANDAYSDPIFSLPSFDRRGIKIEYLNNYRWRVTIKTPGAAKRNHMKKITGRRADADQYAVWFLGVHTSAGVLETVSQTELQELTQLRAKAVEFERALRQRVLDGAMVQPGPLSLGDAPA